MNRRSIMVVGGAVFLGVLLTRLQPRASEHELKVDDELRSIPQRWLDAEARRDRAALDRLIADDFMGAGLGPGILTKDDIVPSEGAGENRFPKSKVEETTARQYDSAAVVMGRLATDDPNGSTKFLFTLVFIKRPQGWQMVAAHLSRVVANP